MSSVLGLDIGGANLKAAHTDGRALSLPFALWKEPDRLPHALRKLSGMIPPADVWAVTMTGELCDCFESKRQGVHAILDAVAEVAGDTPVRVWRNDGIFVDLATARETALQVAAANWLALATFVGPYAGGCPGILLDIGSTTTDIIPLQNGKPVPQGRTDPERFRAKELIYTGVRRTPLCALLGSEGAAELFATTLDVYLVLGCLPEDPDDHNTADGRPATRAAAHARLARMVCADLETSTEEQREELADLVAVRQTRMLRDALRQNLERVGIADGPAAVILAGEGEFLARRILADPARFWIKEIVLSTKLGMSVSQAACAYAVAMLAAKE
jgi:probable H4MPT-linked C1 transfer pathway protein